jgi:PHD/YefM family antitoxin component YafN of YafNO toxin-antitoxin module
VSASPIVPLALGQLNDVAITLTTSQVQDLKNGLLYVNVHSSNFTAGEIRGQFVSSLSSTTVQFNATNYIVYENTENLLLAVTRTGNLTNAVTINYATSNGSAQAPGDFVNASGELQFAPGESVKFVSVPIVDDALVEGAETLKLTLSSPSGGAVEGSPFTTTISILDDDKPLIVTEQNTPRAAAVDSVWLLRDPFSLGSLQNFSADHHTRITFFATGVELLPGETASALVVRLEDNQNRIYPLVVEDVRKVPGFEWLTQIVVRLPDSIESEGDFRISLTLRGVTGNKPVVTIVR